MKKLFLLLTCVFMLTLSSGYAVSLDEDITKAQQHITKAKQHITKAKQHITKAKQHITKAQNILEDDQGNQQSNSTTHAYWVKLTCLPKASYQAVKHGCLKFLHKFHIAPGNDDESEETPIFTKWRLSTMGN